MISATLSNLRYSLAIQLPVDEKDAHALTLASILTVTLTSLIFLGFLVLFGPRLFLLLNVDKFSSGFYLLPLATFLVGMGLVFNSANLRGKRFTNLALSKIIGAACDRITMLALGFYGFNIPISLITGRILGHLTTLVTLILSKRGYFFTAFSKESFKRLKKVALRYIDFPIYSWSGFFQQLSVQLPVILLGYIFSPMVAGYYALSRRVLAEPIHIVSEALCRSYYQKVSEVSDNREELYTMTKRLLHYLILLIIFPLVLLGLSGNEFFSFAFGDQWRQAGNYASLLVPTYITIFIARPVMVFFDLLEKQKVAFLFNSLFFLLNVTSISIGGIYNNPKLAIGLFSLTSTCSLILQIQWILSKIGFTTTILIKLFLSGISTAAIFSIPIVVVKYFMKESGLMIIIISMLSFFTFVLYIMHTDPIVREKIISLKMRIFTSNLR